MPDEGQEGLSFRLFGGWGLGLRAHLNLPRPRSNKNILLQAYNAYMIFKMYALGYHSHVDREVGFMD